MIAGLRLRITMLNAIFYSNGYCRFYGLRRLLAGGVCNLVFLLAVGFLFAVNPVQSAELRDLDRDGVADKHDNDQDNDGLLNQAEGYQSVNRAALSTADSYWSAAIAGPVDQISGSRFDYRLLDETGAHVIDFAGAIQSTTTMVTWSVHENLPKIRNQSEGLTVVQWKFLDADNGRLTNVDIDLNVGDLDADRLESLIVPLDSIVGYSVSRNSSLKVTGGGAEQVVLSASEGSEDARDASVTLHLRGVSEITLGYQNSVNQEPVDGVVNNAAGFRHEFNPSVLASYTQVDTSEDTDSDGIPDHRDLDSNNDGINDVEALVAADLDEDGMADGAVGSDGVVQVIDSREAIIVSSGTANTAPVQNLADDDHDGILDLFDANSKQFGEGDTDTDGDRLSDQVEVSIGTAIDNPDTDGDGVSDADEVNVYQTDPLSSSSAQAGSTDLTDSDKDGLTDKLEGMGDADQDGVPNLYDIDSDNDGIADIVEAGGVDQNGDGMVDGNTSKLVPLVLQGADFDGDGTANYIDLDSDQDSVSDLRESGGVDADRDGRVDDFVDQNGDGWADVYFGATLVWIDTDNDGNPDVLDRHQPTVNVLQDDEPTAVENSQSFQTGIQGNPGCVLILDPVNREYTLLLLLLIAVAGLFYRRSCVMMMGKN